MLKTKVYRTAGMVFPVFLWLYQPHDWRYNDCKHDLTVRNVQLIDEWSAVWCMEITMNKRRTEVNWCRDDLVLKSGCETVFFCTHVRSTHNEVTSSTSAGGGGQKAWGHVSSVFTSLRIVQRSFQESMRMVVQDLCNSYAANSKIDGRNQRGKRYTMSLVVGSRLRSVVYRRFFTYIDIADELLQPIWTVCSDEIVRCIASAGIEEKQIEDVKTLLNMFSKNGAEVLAGLVKEILQKQACVTSFRSGQLSVSRSRFIADGYSSYLKGNME